MLILTKTCRWYPVTLETWEQNNLLHQQTLRSYLIAKRLRTASCKFKWKLMLKPHNCSHISINYAAENKPYLNSSWRMEVWPSDSSPKCWFFSGERMHRENDLGRIGGHNSDLNLKNPNNRRTFYLVYL